MKPSVLKSAFLVLLSFFSGIVSAQIQFYEKHEFINTRNDTMRYLLLRNENGNEKVPLIIFLHGAGEIGRDNEKQLVNAPKIVTDSAFRSTYSFCYVVPQCKPGKAWVMVRWRKTRYKMKKNISSQLGLVKQLIDSFVVSNNIDTNRIYITGASMGGLGTWDMICRYPNTFAAATLCEIHIR